MRADFHESANSVPGYEAGGWTGLGAPVNTPSEIVATLNQHVNAALAALPAPRLKTTPTLPGHGRHGAQVVQLRARH